MFQCRQGLRSLELSEGHVLLVGVRYDFEQRRLTRLDDAHATLHGSDDILRLCDSLAVRSECFRHLHEVAARRLRAVKLVRRGEVLRPLYAHRRVVEHYGQDRDFLAHRRLKIGTDHSEAVIADDIHAQLVRCRQLAPHRRSKAVPQLR